MGGSDSKGQNVNNFRPEEWKQIDIPSKFKRHLLVHQRDPNLFVQKNIFQVADQNQYGLARILYQLRYHSRQLVSNQYLSIEDVDNACSKSQVGYLYTQRIDLRLSEVYNIPYPDILHVYYQCFEGFEKLMHKVGYFRIDDDCIGVNEDLVVKVWHSSNFAQINPSYPIRTQQQMVQTIINVIQSHTDIKTMPSRQPSFGDFLFRHQGQRIGFNQAKKYLRQYSYLYNRGTIPDCLGHLAYYDDNLLRSIPMALVGGSRSPNNYQPRTPQRYNFLGNAVDMRYDPLPEPTRVRSRPKATYNTDLHPTINSKIRRPPASTTHTLYQPIVTTVTPNVLVSHLPPPTIVRPSLSPPPIVHRPIISTVPVIRPQVNFSFMPETSIVRPLIVPPINQVASSIAPLSSSQTGLSNPNLRQVNQQTGPSTQNQQNINPNFRVGQSVISSYPNQPKYLGQTQNQGKPNQQLTPNKVSSSNAKPQLSFRNDNYRPSQSTRVTSISADVQPKVSSK